MPLQGDDGPTITRSHNMRFDLPFEAVIEGGDEPIGVPGGLDEFGRHRVARDPKFYGLIIDGEGAAPHISVCPGRVFPRPTFN